MVVDPGSMVDRGDPSPAYQVRTNRTRSATDHRSHDSTLNPCKAKICDYVASISANTKVIDNPARKKAHAEVREAEKALADTDRGLAALLADPAITPAAKNTRLIPPRSK